MKNLIPMLVVIMLACSWSANAQRNRASKPNPINAVPQIVGGFPTTIDQLPWQVILTTSKGATGGSIIGSRWILTAAHVVDGESVNSLKVYAGVTFDSQRNSGQVLTVDRIIMHPNYQDVSYDFSLNDIALLHVSTDIVLGPNAQIIEMATASTDDAGIADVGAIATNSGWGNTSFNGPRPDQLNAVEMPIADINIVGDWYRQNFGYMNVTDANNKLGAGFATGGAAGCYGDSGGPLIARDQLGTPFLVGVENGGFCNTYTIYSRVSRYCNWISDQMTSDYSINVDFSSCDAYTFTLNRPLASNSNFIRWEAQPRNLITNFSARGSSYTANVTPGASGYVTISALTLCASTPITTTIYVGGAPPITGFYHTSSNPGPSTSPLQIANYVPTGYVHMAVSAGTFGNPNAAAISYSFTSQFPTTTVQQSSPGSNVVGFQLGPVGTANERVYLDITATGPGVCAPTTQTFYFFVPRGRSAYTVFPNPAASELTIQEVQIQSGVQPSNIKQAQKSSTAELPAKDFDARLYNNLGKIVKTGRFYQGRVKLDLLELPNGLYTLRIGSGKDAHSQLVQVAH
ncbi:trypsin-like serine protease [Hymenobacter sp.]|jgi:hypothetical protein|uniref:trypsin-like serine protease n=1 Tax=Hymenobacter sp. TaxID=1898978 RepID=UPI002EDB0136